MISKRDALPDGALLNRYDIAGCYTDCYTVEIDQSVDLTEYTEAFYTTWLFKLERFILKWAVSRPSTDSDAKRLAAGSADTFAAWTVEDRRDDQLLMCDFRERTRSWLMVANLGNSATRLFFGSAVVPKGVSALSDKTAFLCPWVLTPLEAPLERRFTLLLGFHRLYSRALLRAAVSRLSNRFSA